MVDRWPEGGDGLPVTLGKPARAPAVGDEDGGRPVGGEDGLGTNEQRGLAGQAKP